MTANVCNISELGSLIYSQRHHARPQPLLNSPHLMPQALYDHLPSALYFILETLITSEKQKPSLSLHVA